MVSPRRPQLPDYPTSRDSIDHPASEADTGLVEGLTVSASSCREDHSLMRLVGDLVGDLGTWFRS